MLSHLIKIHPKPREEQTNTYQKERFLRTKCFICVILTLLKKGGHIYVSTSYSIGIADKRSSSMSFKMLCLKTPHPEH